jgi:hypothetical protein
MTNKLSIIRHVQSGPDAIWFNDIRQKVHDVGSFKVSKNRLKKLLCFHSSKPIVIVIVF